MTLFPDDAPLRLSLPWMPPVTDEGRLWEATLGDYVDDAKLGDYFWFKRYEIVGDRIFFYLHTEKRKNALKKQLRDDRNWKTFLKRFPEAKLEWAEDVLEERA